MVKQGRGLPGCEGVQENVDKISCEFSSILVYHLVKFHPEENTHTFLHVVKLLNITQCGQNGCFGRNVLPSAKKGQLLARTAAGRSAYKFVETQGQGYPECKG